MWRCFFFSSLFYLNPIVFSTHVEVFLNKAAAVNQIVSLLHACGGVSHLFNITNIKIRSSPRMWRCFPAWDKNELTNQVFSTHVEVFLYPYSRTPTNDQSSPRMWRCFQLLYTPSYHLYVFSTHVEVFLIFPDQIAQVI